MDPASNHIAGRRGVTGSVLHVRSIDRNRVRISGLTKIEDLVLIPFIVEPSLPAKEAYIKRCCVELEFKALVLDFTHVPLLRRREALTRRKRNT